MQTVNISDFRANLLKYLDLANSGEPISVTSSGKLLATIAPPIDQQEEARQNLEQLSKTAKIHDVTTPINCHWNAMP